MKIFILLKFITCGICIFNKIVKRMKGIIFVWICFIKECFLLFSNISIVPAFLLSIDYRISKFVNCLFFLCAIKLSIFHYA